MKTFSDPFHDKEAPPCPVCGTWAKRDGVLIPIAGTQEGNICQAKVVHLDYLVSTLTFYEEKGDYNAFFAGPIIK